MFQRHFPNFLQNPFEVSQPHIAGHGLHYYGSHFVTILAEEIFQPLRVIVGQRYGVFGEVGRHAG